jgi:hypothetical protein
MTLKKQFMPPGIKAPCRPASFTKVETKGNLPWHRCSIASQSTE